MRDLPYNALCTGMGQLSRIQTTPEDFDITVNKQRAMDALAHVTPFCFLPKEEREELAEQSKELREYPDGAVICSPDLDDSSTFIVCEGRVAGVVDHNTGNDRFYEMFEKGEMFGIDCAVLEHRRNTTRIAKGKCTVVAIPAGPLRRAIQAERSREVRISIARTFTAKVPVGDDLSAFKTYVRDGVRSGKIEIHELLKRFRRVEPVLHRYILDDSTLDTAAWSYAVKRLPKFLTKTYVFFMTTRLPDWF